MEIVIQHLATKRRINGPLSICGSRKDLSSFARQITEHLNSNPSVAHGWISIVDQPETLAGVSPKGWEE